MQASLVEKAVGPNADMQDSLWMVAFFDGISTPSYHPVPWHFRPDGSLEAANIWTAEWKQIAADRVHCKMLSGGSGEWDVVFVNDRWFIGYQNNSTIFRIGYKK